MSGIGGVTMSYLSPSTRRAWIEIVLEQLAYNGGAVALHPEGVDRNNVNAVRVAVALPSPSTRRAWIEILPTQRVKNIYCVSPSTRRAWIEMSSALDLYLLVLSPSTRRAWIEIRISNGQSEKRWSPSTRRAWIEMSAVGAWAKYGDSVALHPEGVDRNAICAYFAVRFYCRPPPGGRG